MFLGAHPAVRVQVLRPLQQAEGVLPLPNAPSIVTLQVEASDAAIAHKTTLEKRIEAAAARAAAAPPPPREA